MKSRLLVGLATDFCVTYSALDATADGFDVTIKMDAFSGSDTAGSLESALMDLRDAGVQLV